ncbi:MAG: hemolysin family protein [Candidatus Omnitrophica bacterium]|nr:hemolysin family protein [Candidatus Omnitrophota bacterium]
MTEYLIKISLLILLLALAAITAASETSIISVSRIRLRKLARDGSRAARLIIKILEAPERFFGTILVANNVVNVMAASIMTAIMIYVLDDENKGVLFATVIVTFLIIVFEVAAKTFAARYPERLSLALARPVKFLIDIFAPVVRILDVITNAILNAIGGKATGKSYLITEEEIRAMIKMGEEDDALQKEMYKMLSKVFDFNKTVVKNVMTPKKGMIAIDINADFDNILEKVLESGYSRLPVYKDNPDNIVGVINMKDLLNMAANRNLVVLHDIIYSPTFVPDTKKVTELLKEFQKGHTHIAVVTDAQNRVVGIITLEDLLEEIVGEISDEYDFRSSKKIKS